MKKKIPAGSKVPVPLTLADRDLIREHTFYDPSFAAITEVKGKRVVVWKIWGQAQLVGPGSGAPPRATALRLVSAPGTPSPEAILGTGPDPHFTFAPLGQGSWQKTTARSDLPPFHYRPFCVDCVCPGRSPNAR